VFSRNGAVMTETLETVTKKKPEPTAEQQAAEELVRRAREQGGQERSVDEGEPAAGSYPAAASAP
jgi:hypothetical protein